MSRKRKSHTHIVDTGILCPAFLNEKKFVMNKGDEYVVFPLKDIIAEHKHMGNASKDMVAKVRSAENLTSSSVATGTMKCVPFCAYMHLGKCVYHHIVVCNKKQYILADDVSSHKSTRIVFAGYHSREELSDIIAKCANSSPNSYLFDLPLASDPVEDIMHLKYLGFFAACE